MNYFTKGEEAAAFKQRLVEHCTRMLLQRIANTVNTMDLAQAAANGEEKSSAGDKYETARAMSQREVALHATQLLANRRELAGISATFKPERSGTVGSGSLVECNTCLFLIAAGLGKAIFDEKIVYLVAPQAPIARMLSGRKAGDDFSFNQQTLTIKAVW